MESRDEDKHLQIDETHHNQYNIDDEQNINNILNGGGGNNNNMSASRLQ